MSLQVFYGGTFDPVHAGHLATAEAAAVALGVPVRLMPAADPPHRAAPGANAEQRAAMLDLMVDGQPMLRVDRRELSRHGRSYTIDTLRELRAEYGQDMPLAFVIGADSLCALHSWKDWRELLDGAHWVVAERPGSSLEVFDRERIPQIGATVTGSNEIDARADVDVDAGVGSALALDPALLAALSGRWAASPELLRERAGGCLWRLRQPLHPASASEIRRRIVAGGDWAVWLSSAVADYIRRHRLYGLPAGGAAAMDDALSEPEPSPTGPAL